MIDGTYIIGTYIIDNPGSIRILVLDDKDDGFIKNELDCFSFQHYRADVDTCGSLEDAIAKIQESEEKLKFYHVVISEMVIGQDFEVGLKLLEYLHYSKTIKIILTAHASFTNCEQCFHNSAYAYINKKNSKPDPYDEIERYIRSGLNKVRKDSKREWVMNQIPVYQSMYPGKEIAVIERTVVDVDDNFDDLSDRVKKLYPLFTPAYISVPRNRWLFYGEKIND